MLLESVILIVLVSAMVVRDSTTGRWSATCGQRYNVAGNTLVSKVGRGTSGDSSFRAKKGKTVMPTVEISPPIIVVNNDKDRSSHEEDFQNINLGDPQQFISAPSSSHAPPSSPPLDTSDLMTFLIGEFAHVKGQINREKHKVISIVETRLNGLWEIMVDEIQCHMSAISTKIAKNHHYLKVVVLAKIEEEIALTSDLLHVTILDSHVEIIEGIGNLPKQSLDHILKVFKPPHAPPTGAPACTIHDLDSGDHENVSASTGKKKNQEKGKLETKEMTTPDGVLTLY